MCYVTNQLENRRKKEMLAILQLFAVSAVGLGLFLAMNGIGIGASIFGAGFITAIITSKL